MDFLLPYLKPPKKVSALTETDEVKVIPDAAEPNKQANVDAMWAIIPLAATRISHTRKEHILSGIVVLVFLNVPALCLVRMALIMRHGASERSELGLTRDSLLSVATHLYVVGALGTILTCILTATHGKETRLLGTSMTFQNSALATLAVLQLLAAYVCTISMSDHAQGVAGGAAAVGAEPVARSPADDAEAALRAARYKPGVTVLVICLGEEGGAWSDDLALCGPLAVGFLEVEQAVGEQPSKAAFTVAPSSPPRAPAHAWRPWWRTRRRAAVAPAAATDSLGVSTVSIHDVGDVPLAVGAGPGLSSPY